jgi:MerR HTH family regulatory protein
MQVKHASLVWLDKSQEVSLQELMEVSGFSEGEVLEFVDLGVIEPMHELDPPNDQIIPLSFYADCIITIRKVSRLRDELELDAHALAVMFSLLQKIQSLEKIVNHLQAQRPVF